MDTLISNPSNSKLMKKLLLILLGLGVIGVAVGYYMYNKPVESLENKKPAMEVTAAKIVEDYQANETTANDLYLGKVIQVNGKVGAVTTEEGKKKITIDSGNPMSAIICEMEDDSEAANVQAGQDIAVKGKCSGYLSDVILVQAHVVK